MTSTLAPTHPSARRLTGRPLGEARREAGLGQLDPDRLPRYQAALYRAAGAMCTSQQDVEDLVQETFVNVLKRPRLLHAGNEIGYLRRALKNTPGNLYRIAQRRPATRQLLDDDAPAAPSATSMRARCWKPSPARRPGSEMP